MKPNIIVIAIKAGGGHIAAMNSILAAFYPKDESYIKGYVSTNTSVNNIHEFLNLKLPWLYEFGYNISNTKEGRLLPQDPVSRSTIEQFKDELKFLFDEFETKVLISTHFLTTQALLELKTELKSDLKLIAYVPDYDTSLVHFPYGDMQLLNGLIVQSYTYINKIASTYNYPRSRMIKAGFIPSEEFTKVSKLSVEDIYTSLNNRDSNLKNISKTKFKILIAGGSGWTSTISDKVIKLLKVLSPRLKDIQFLVITGSNQVAIKKYQKMRSMFQELDIVTLPRLAHSELARVYKISDLIILASIAPASLFELMQVNAAPILLTKANPAQESYNKDYAVQEGLVELVLNQEDLNNRVVELLDNKNELERVREIYRWNYKQQLESGRYNASEMAKFVERVSLL